MKLCVVTNMEAPYRVSVWNSLAEICDELHVIVLCEKEENRSWDLSQLERKYTLHNLNSASLFIGKLDTALYWGGGIRKVLSEVCPEAIIVTGYTAGPFIEAMLWAKKNSVQLVQWFESHKKSSRMRSALYNFIRKKMLRMANTYIVPGELSKEYLEDMGVDDRDIFIGANTVDVDKLSSDRCLDFDYDVTNFLYVGQLIRRKNVGLLVDAFLELNFDNKKLYIVGGGEEEEELTYKYRGNRFIEFVGETTSIEETSKYYSMADVLVMPSANEVWGLVINEALAAGCYVLSSSEAGVTRDLVENSSFDVGKVVDIGNGSEGLKLRMEDAIANIKYIRNNRSAISEWGKSFAPSVTAEVILRAVKR